MKLQTHNRLLIGVSALTLLACSTVNRLAEGGLTALTPTAPPALEANPSELIPANAPLVLENGLTLGTPREARIEQADENSEVIESRATEDYSAEEANGVGNTLTYTLSAQADERLLWIYGWCATSPQLVEDNLSNMRIEFLVEGVPVEVSQFDVADGVQIANDGTQLPCRSYTAVVYNWPAGTTTLETRVTFLEPINDGMGDFEAGEIVFRYEVTGE